MVKRKNKSYLSTSKKLFVTGITIIFIILVSLPNTEFNNVVLITANGFSPDFITVPIGTNVIWINQDKNMHWPASDFHPTHNLYPESGGCIGSKLDACHGLLRREKYTFTFDKVGVWTIHDHLHPGLTMTVNVVDKETTNVEDYSGQRKTIKELSASDPKQAWVYLKRTFIADNQVTENVHDLAHVIGNDLYLHYGFEGIKFCTDEFAFGCYHGVTEKMLLDNGLDAIPKAESECIEIFPNQSQPAVSCIHGIGHGVITFENLNIIKALDDCDVLDDQYKSYCYDGVFMEYTSSAVKDAFNEKNPWNLCSNFSAQRQQACARYQVFIFQQRFGWNLTQTAQGCSEATSTLTRETCFSSFGFLAAEKSKGDINQINEICSLAPDEGQNICITYAAIEVIFQEYTNWRNVSAALCEQLDENWKTRCLNSIQETINNYRRD